MRINVPLDNGLRLIGNNPLFVSFGLKSLDCLAGSLRRLDRRVSNGFDAPPPKLDIGMADLIIHGGHKLNTRNIADNFENLWRVPELVDKRRIARGHATKLNRARSSVVEAVVKNIPAEDVLAVLEYSFMRQKGERFCGGDWG